MGGDEEMGVDGEKETDEEDGRMGGDGGEQNILERQYITAAAFIA